MAAASSGFCPCRVLKGRCPEYRALHRKSAQQFPIFQLPPGPQGCYTPGMFRLVALRLLPCCFLFAALSACKQTSFKFPKLKFQNRTGTADSAATGPAIAGVGVPSRSAEETAFLEKCTALGASGATITGRDGYFFSGTELQRLAQLQDPNAASLRAATVAIVDYRTQLKNKGIELIFVPVPPKAILFPDKLDKDLKIKIRRKKPARLDSTLQSTYAALRAKGVRVVDPTDALLDARETKKSGPIFPKTAASWSPRAAEITAALIASELKGASWANQPGKEGSLITEAANLTYSGPLSAGTPASETLSLRNIGRSADGKMRSVTFSTGGHPLALIGDANLLAWREANNPVNSSGAFASLADQLAYEFQTTPDLFPGKTDGRNAARQRILREATNGRNPLASTKVLIWVVSASDLALSDWKRVPLRLDFNLSAPPVMLEAPVTLIPDAPLPGRAPVRPAPDSQVAPADPAAPQLPR